MVIEVPVLFLIFNRLETTKLVFEQIKRAKPVKLYIAADGPRNKVEKSKTDLVRKYVLDNIEWDCDVRTLFRKKNLGCGKAVSGAITWFFENEEMGIILEDDCLPDQSFFPFCEELLLKYKDNKKIMHISGNNFLYNSKLEIKESYFFSKYPHIWGWATWRRAWKKHDFKMKNWVKIKNSVQKKYLFDNKEQELSFSEWFDNLSKNPYSTWDVQWVFSIWYNRGLCVYPNKNLVKNIGFGIDSTHTTSTPSFVKGVPLESINRIIHPKHIVRNVIADNFDFNKCFYVPFYKRIFFGNKFVVCIYRKIKSVLEV